MLPQSSQNALLGPGFRLMIGAAMICIPVGIAFVPQDLGWDSSAPVLFTLLGREAGEELEALGTIGGALVCGVFVLRPVIKSGAPSHQRVAWVLYSLLLVEATFLIIDLLLFFAHRVGPG